MRLIRASYQIMSDLDSDNIIANIELAGRTCYKSEDKITSDSSSKFIRMLISRGHESVLEHEKITARFICDRGISHELVRHRIASFSQESTRYCNYCNERNQYV
ncbi:FAD-dependent thymidylate synthase [Parabacteroides provencensis]|uniref:FAD-dependent thymidylate synthase n=1 Tax=Parabacteroides provencensis TaxID=1944636 RepID=UPI000C149314